MRRVLPALLLTVLSVSAHAAPVTVPGTNVQFTVPAGFVKMPPDILKLKYSRGTPPAAVYSTPGPHWDVNIAFAVRRAQVPADLGELQSVLERSVQGAPGFRWESHSVQKLGERSWVVLRFWVSGLDTPIYNDLRAVPVPGGLLIVTANATKAQYPKYLKPLTAALDSLR
ncbi:hypothetical protein GO986_00510 [Deinococcus sp. HMF7620]|uniref:DUF1795 domain-containing protein n=1 Tax=Deinococcus arboris TaxID=2682977 RepID=A0A7C9HP74_9DEIO|nr:hypothetical protein [Deinococcus arboris]MVN85252.1 hypothetical protein [Deinococcus arboris]